MEYCAKNILHPDIRDCSHCHIRLRWSCGNSTLQDTCTQPILNCYCNAFIKCLCTDKSDTLVVTTTPEMHCDGCENKINKNIRFVKGTKKIETSVPKQTVTIVYDGRKTTYADYESAFKKIGYSVKKVKR